MRRLSFRARASCAALLAVFFLARAARADVPRSKYSETAYATLKDLVDRTPLEEMDLSFFKKVYRFDHAPDMLKFLLSRPEYQAKSQRLAELRKFYDWTIQGEFARKNFLTIENTNQGKSNGARSDLDATANVLDFDPASGKWALRQRVGELIEYQKAQYAKEGLTPDGVDVTLFNGDVFMPDWRNARMGFVEYVDEVLKTTSQLKQTKGAYYAPGANREQTHDRALADGRTVHIGWDYAANRPSINGRAIEFDAETGKVVWLDFDKVKGEYRVAGPVEELLTREASTSGESARYADVLDLPATERWRRALGNIVQNMDEFFKPHDPVSRNKYFIERVVDQGAGRFTQIEPSTVRWEEPAGTPPTYVQVHELDPKSAWKQAYIQQAFGLATGDARIAEIQSVLDRSAEIQLDKTKNRASYPDRAQSKHANYYFRDEWQQAVGNTAEQVRRLEADAAAAGRPAPSEETLRLQENEAERLFVEKQQRIVAEAAVQVTRETFRRENESPDTGAFADPETQAKIKFDRGVEVALLLDVIETSPLPQAERDSLRQRVVEAIPESSRGLTMKIAELAGLKLKLSGRAGLGLERYLKAEDGISDRSLWAEVAEALGQDPGGEAVPEDAARKAFADYVRMNLGPADAARFEQAWEAGKKALIAKFGAQSYWKEITQQADGMMMAGAALGLINAYQQSCAGQTSWTEECMAGLASETGNQVLFMLPYINTGSMVLSGLKDIQEGRLREGAAGLSLGVFSLPSIASAIGVSGGTLIHVYVGYQILKLGVAVTYGYAVQTMENDAVEQAFKAIPVPGIQARPFPSAGRSTVFNGDTPTIPLLADVVDARMAPAAGYTDAQRNQLAGKQSAPAIQAELEQLGLKPGTAAWDTKQAELVVRYGMLLPYLQRSAKIYQVFGPKAEALGDDEDSLLPSCLSRIDEDLEKKYAGEPGMMSWLRYRWNPLNKEKDRQKDLADGWSECVSRTAEAERPRLRPLWDRYLNGWFALQSPRYATAYNTPEFRERLQNALTREYVIHRYMDHGYENERQMKKALAGAREQTATKLKLMGTILGRQQPLVRQLGEQLKNAPAGGKRPAIKTQLILRAPPFAVRVGDPAYVDVAVRGERTADDRAKVGPGGDWKVDLNSEVVKVSLAPPDNLIITPELRRELTPEPGQCAKRLVTIEKRLRAQLKDKAGAVLANAETTVRYFDLVEWEGALTVEVRAAGADAGQTAPYPYALVRLSGAAQAAKETANPGAAGGSAVASFRPLPEGGITVHVEPRSTDVFHRAADAQVKLTGVSESRGEGGALGIALGDATQTVTVVLPYVAPARRAANAPAPPRSQPVDSALPAPTPPRRASTGEEATDTQLVADCEARLRQAQSALARRDLSGAESRLAEAGQRKCAGSAAAGQLEGLQGQLRQAQREREAEINALLDQVRQRMAACDYRGAAAIARQLADLDPANVFVGANQASLDQLARLDADIRGLLADAANPSNDAEARATLGRLRQIQAEAPPCLAASITAAMAGLERRLAGPAARDRIRAAMAACNYAEALAGAMALQAVEPTDEWLAANLGRLQSAAAEQSAILTLLGLAKSASPETADGLAAQLRQELATAPSCMAAQIQAALSELERLGGRQKPAWLEGPSHNAGATSPEDNLNRARETLAHTAEDEANQQARAAEQQRQEEARRREQQAAAQVEQQRREDAATAREAELQRQRAEEIARRRREAAQARQQQIGGILSGLAGVLSGGKIPLPSIPGPKPPSGGAAPPSAASSSDPFVGSWSCQINITSHRNMDVAGGLQTTRRIMVSKSGSGYIFDDGESQDRSTSVRGNTVTLARRFQYTTEAPEKRMHWVTGSAELQSTGTRMTGEERVSTDEGGAMTMTLQCTR